MKTDDARKVLEESERLTGSCSYCGGAGWYPVVGMAQDPSGGEDPIPVEEQEQCRNCDLYVRLATHLRAALEDVEMWDKVYALVDGHNRDYWNTFTTDDHMVTLDHKDEMDAAEIVVACIDAISIDAARAKMREES